jgi:hypothetical protein
MTNRSSSRETLLQRFEEIVGGQLTAQRKERILRLIDRFGEASLTTDDRIVYWANIREQPPAMTSEEAKKIFHRWEKEQSAELEASDKILTVSTALSNTLVSN